MVYKIRVILDTKEDIFRDVEIKGKQTLWNLHLGIKSAFSLQGDELSTFNILESDGTIAKSIPLEDMSDNCDGEIMSDIYIDEVFSQKGDKVQFQYGLLDLWEFFCELVETSEDKPSVKYPITVYRYGKMPLKAPKNSNGFSSQKVDIISDEDFLLSDTDFSSFQEEDSEDYDEDFNDDYYDEQQE